MIYEHRRLIALRSELQTRFTRGTLRFFLGTTLPAITCMIRNSIVLMRLTYQLPRIPRRNRGNSVRSKSNRIVEGETKIRASLFQRTLTAH